MEPRDGQPDSAALGLVFRLGLAWVVGTAAGTALGGRAFWLLLAVFPLGWGCWSLLHRRPVPRPALIAAAVLVAAAWASTDRHHTRRDDIRRFVTDESQLAVVGGEVVGPVVLSPAQRGGMGAFAYRPPGTLLQLRSRWIEADGSRQPASGDLLVRINQVDTRLRDGQSVVATGWLSAIEPPLNPGEQDQHARLADRGIHGRLTTDSSDNVQRLGLAPPLGPLAWWRRYLADQALHSLRLGLDATPTRGLLETMLLGRWEGLGSDLDVSFREVGLTHLLSISGAHLGILAWLAWMAVRLVIHRPPRAAALVMVMLALYLIVLPWQVPIIRAGLMAGLLGIGYILGRRLSSLDLLALAAVVVLVWQPGQVMQAGFQLSFGVVAALLLYTRRLGQWIWSDPLLTVRTTAGLMAARLAADFAAANLIAFLIAFPVVALHFQLVTPLNILMSVLAFPVVTAMLGLGYLKLGAGLVWPSAGVILAGPLQWVTGMLIALVEQGRLWPGATITLLRPPSVLWTWATLAVVVAWLTGRFQRRRLALLVAAVFCGLWMVVQTGRPAMLDMPQAVADTLGGDQTVRLRLNALAVGDGSCFLVRIWGDRSGWDRPHVVMFDCGSQQYLDVGLRTVLPAMQALGVRAIDTMVVSHADMDHFCGMWDVMDRVPVREVLTTAYVLEEANQHPTGATAALLAGIEKRGIPVTAVQRGWRRQVGQDATLEALWPMDGLDLPRNNDQSLILRIGVAGRRVLLTGDVQEDAIVRIMKLDQNDALADLRADICDLAHHGSFGKSSPQWLQRIAPAVAIQSSGRGTLRRMDRRDPWAEVTQQQGVQLLITASSGMVQVQIHAGGDITCRSFRAGEIPLPITAARVSPAGPVGLGG